MVDLAARAGVSPATPFNHFGSKKAILRTIIDRSLLDQPQLNIVKPNCVGQVVTALVNMTRLYSRDPELFRPVFCDTIADISCSNPALQTALKRIFALLTQARDNGELNKAVDLKILAEQLECYWLGSLLFWANGSVDGPTWITRVEGGLLLMLEGVVTRRSRAKTR